MPERTPRLRRASEFWDRSRPTDLVLVAVGALASFALSCGTRSRPVDAPDGGPDLLVLDLPDGGLAGDYQLSWAVKVGAAALDWGNGAALDETGCTYFSGNYRLAAQLYDAAGEPVLQLPYNSDVEDGFLARYSPSGEPLWAVPLGGSGDDKPRSLDTVYGGVLVPGWFDDQMVVGEGSEQVTLESMGGRDGFLARLSDQGDLVWAKSFGGPSQSDIFHDVAAVPGDRVAAVGTFGEGAVVGLGEPNETHLETGGEQAGVVLAVYGGDGELEWARAVTRSELEAEGFEVAALTDGSLVMGGVFREQAIIGWGEAGETLLESVGDQDVFLARFSADGSLDWAIGLGIAGYIQADTGSSVEVAADGGVIVATGFCGGAPVGKEGEPAEWHDVPDEACTPYFARFTPQGERVWSVAPAGGGSFSQGFSVSVLPNGSIVAGGCYTGTAVFGSGEANETTISSVGVGWANADGFLVMFHPDGYLDWAIALPGPGKNWPVQLDADDRTIVAAGAFHQTTTFGTGPFDSVVLESSGDADAFLMRLDLPETVD